MISMLRWLYWTIRTVTAAINMAVIWFYPSVAFLLTYSKTLDYITLGLTKNYLESPE